MRTTLILLLVAATFNACAPWPGKRFYEARLYHYNAAGMSELFVGDGKFTDTITNPQGKRLSQSQIERIFIALQTERPCETGLAASIPQHAVVFYDERRRPIGVLQLDFLCLGYTTTPRAMGFVDHPDFATIADVCSELNVSPFDRYSAKKYRQNFERMVTPAFLNR